MTAAALTYPDPGIRRGPYRILPYTPGGFVVFDDRAPLGRSVVGAPYTFIEHGSRALEAARAALAALPLPERSDTP